MTESMKDVADALSEEDLDDIGGVSEEDQGETKQLEQSSSNFLDVLRSKSPDEPIENFIDHPLNFDETESTARGIRGLKGFLGALNYALVDLFMALMQKYKENHTPETQEGGLNNAADPEDLGRQPE